MRRGDSSFKRLCVSATGSILAVAALSACNQEPAFVEASKKIDSDDVQVAQRTPEGDGHKEGDAGRGRAGAGEDGVGQGGDGGHGGDGAGDRGGKNDGSGSQKDGLADQGPNKGDGSGTGTGTENTGRTGGGDSGGGGPSNGGGSIGVPNPPVAQQPSPAPTAAPQAKPGSVVTVNKEQAKGKADILFVVDDSGSMEWSQSQLKARFAAFAEALEDMRVDFQVGVTTTDACDIDWSTGAAKADAVCPDASKISGGVKVNGKMVGPQRGEFIYDAETKTNVLKPGAGFVEAFRRVASVGIQGSGFEHGLTAAKMAVQKAMSGVNKGFLRSDAFLSVVVVSDEEDDGIQMWCEDAWGRTSLNGSGQKDLNACKTGGNSPFLDRFGMAPYAIEKKPNTNAPWTNYKMTADAFKAYLDDAAVKGPGRFRVSAITGVRGADGKVSCDNPEIKGGPQESGTNYIKAANLTGGVVENICAKDWSKVLQNIGQNTGELANKFALPAGKVPYPGTLVVKVDGVVWGTTKYSYEAQGNLISFKEVPPMGASISIAYKETVY